MIIRIAGTDYSVEEALDATLGDLDDLDTQSLKLWGESQSVETISNTFVDLEEARQAPGFEAVSLLGNRAFRRSMASLIWLSRRSKDEDVTLAEAARTKFSQFEFVDDDDEVEEDPKAPAPEAADGSVKPE